MNNIFRASVIIGISFGVNKILALLRQYFIAKQFGFSPEIDAFNVANNLPDLIFSLFAGGALAMAFIPVFTEYIDVHGKDVSWKLFSQVATLLFIITGIASFVVAIFAPILVSGSIGIAPGFSETQQALVVTLLRINLIATLLFSLSGLVMASLQAHKHFLLPAIAPIFYNLGIIFGAVVLSPTLGIYGLMYGVVLGAMMHLLVQLPGLFRFKFKFSFSFDFSGPGLRKIFQLMGPRILTVFLIQVMFILRDNFASRLEPGSVTALTYGYFIMQTPETLIGSSLAIALLPTLSSHISHKRHKDFSQVLIASIRILIAFSILPVVLVFALLSPLVTYIFDFSLTQVDLLVWTTNAFMAGLVAQVLLEVLVRAFYAKQDARTPLLATAVRAIIFIILGVLFFQRTGVVGIAAIDSISVAVEAGLLFILLFPVIRQKFMIIKTMGRSLLGGLTGLGIIFAVLWLLHVPVLFQIGIGILLATIVYLLFILKEVRLLIKL